MFDPGKHPTLIHARDRSVSMLSQIRRRLFSIPELAPEISMIAISGSLGRFEGLAHSDCDIIVLVENHAINEALYSSRTMEIVCEVLAPLGMPLPKSDGIYATPASLSQLCDYDTLGLIADDKDIFGKRMQVLLDARPVYGMDNYERLVRNLLERYAAGFLVYDQTKEWVYLLNDLIRYFKSYCSWRQFDLTSDSIDGWYIRNAKLRNSRLLMFAALILLLGECSKEKKDKITWLHEHIKLTPMQRIEKVYKLNNDNNFYILLDAYEIFMEKMNSARFRDDLLAAKPKSLADIMHMRPSGYGDLHDSSAVMLKELTRFVMDRRNIWSEAFFEYLIF